jgi:uncharacterized protein YqgC (DUF456 family)
MEVIGLALFFVACLLAFYGALQNGHGPEAGCRGLISWVIAAIVLLAALGFLIIPHLRWVS